MGGVLNKTLLPRCLEEDEALEIEDETVFYDQVLTYLKGGAIVAAKPISAAKASKTGRGGGAKSGGGKASKGGGSHDAADEPPSPLSKEAKDAVRRVEAKAKRAMNTNKPKAEVAKLAAEMLEVNGGPMKPQQIGYKTWEASLTYEPKPGAAPAKKPGSTNGGTKRKKKKDSDEEEADPELDSEFEAEEPSRETIEIDEDEEAEAAPTRTTGASHMTARGRSKPLPPHPPDKDLASDGLVPLMDGGGQRKRQRQLHEFADELLPALMSQMRESQQFAQSGVASSQGATAPTPAAADPNLARFLALAEESSKQAATNANNLERLTSLCEQQQKTIADQNAMIDRQQSDMLAFQNTAWQVIAGQHQTLSQQTQHLGSLVGMASSCFRQLQTHHSRDARTVEFLTQGAICQAFGNQEAFAKLTKPQEMPEKSASPDALSSLDQAVAATAASQSFPPPAAASQIGGATVDANRSEAQQHTPAASAGAAAPPAPAMPPTTMPHSAFTPASMPPPVMPPPAIVNTGPVGLHGHISPQPPVLVQAPIAMGASTQPGLFLPQSWAPSSQASQP